MANTPRIDGQWFSSFCALGPRPLVATGWLLVWLRGHFAALQNILDPTGALEHSIWTSDFKTTEIAIESVTRWKPEITEHRPAIIVKRNDWQNIKLGIDNRMIPGGSDGQSRYTDWWQGSHTLFCISGDGAEVEKLAAEVFLELDQFGPFVRRILELKKFQVMKVGAVARLKGNARENFVVPIDVAYIYENAWRTPGVSPLLQSLSQEIDLANFQP